MSMWFQNYGIFLFNRSTDHEPQRVAPALETSLKSLNTDYLDAYLVHFPFRITQANEPLYYKKEWLVETWREMVKLKEKEKAHHIGVSNFSQKKLEMLMEEGEAPEINQSEIIGNFSRSASLSAAK
ncbi:Aldo-keto reductase family 1 member C18 [Thelohanellus kitauei]|uniref:Aldo-keto reductase family 1 member C18 n=1 Tax=Thelohanellus kitauei TaxID=669202 RepID=A0A0C2J387_THEKT|nr:Aldo-keto reductase family 1 member C18 [Thelohanellus kitauei]